MVNLIITLAIGAVIGWIASQIVQTRGGLLLDMLVGVLGAFLASFFLGKATFISGSFSLTSLFYSLLGAIVLMLLLKVVMRPPGE
ncbi:MAG: GlsB/YeaQ/YmgE family stress response membrane protein [Chloroflexi bacterium]|nr:GlsB/YeaQ/YmgE family stress response membrane protein [Chloroflexota bacterium]